MKHFILWFLLANALAFAGLAIHKDCQLYQARQEIHQLEQVRLPDFYQTQTFLQQKGYYKGKIDGDFSTLSIDAWRRYNHDRFAAKWIPHDKEGVQK